MTNHPDSFPSTTVPPEQASGTFDADARVDELLEGIQKDWVRDEQSISFPGYLRNDESEQRDETKSDGARPLQEEKQVSSQHNVSNVETKPTSEQRAATPVIVVKSERPEGYRLRTKLLAGGALALVILYAGYKFVNDIENFFGGIGNAVTPQEQIERESNAALNRLTIPGDTIAVDGYGSAVTATGVGFKCPKTMTMICDAVPRSHDGVVPYVDSQASLTGDDQAVIGAKAWTFSSKVDSQNHPHTVVDIDTGHVWAQWANDIVKVNSHDYLTENIADLLNIKTGVNEVNNSSVATAQDVFLQTCREPLAVALPSGIAHYVHNLEQNLANTLTNPEDATAKKRLQQMAGQTVIIRFNGNELNLNGPQVVPNGTIQEAGLNFTETVTKECHLSEQAQAALDEYKKEKGIDYEIEQMVPLATGPRIDTTHPIAVG